MKITLIAWAAANYSPPPSKWVLWRWVREGQLHPKPELVGKTYYVEENARRLVPGEPAPRMSLVERIKAEDERRLRAGRK